MATKGKELPSKNHDNSESKILNRYTSLPIALDILYRKQITLLSPDTWEDRNDAYFLECYRDEENFKSVLALCFSLRRETFHQWRIFSSGPSGVCIEFDKDKLLRSIPNHNGFRHKKMSYHKIKELQAIKPKLESWPFLKREPFEDEDEYRITFESKTESLLTKSIPIDLASIRMVTLSPWLPDAVAKSVVSIINSIDDCARLKVIRSSLLDNARWRAVIS